MVLLVVKTIFYYLTLKKEKYFYNKKLKIKIIKKFNNFQKKLKIILKIWFINYSLLYFVYLVKLKKLILILPNINFIKN